jgi:hypothetical protein
MKRRESDAECVGLFDSSAEAQSAVQRPVNSRVDREQISLVSQNSERDNAHAGTTGVTDHDTSGALKGAGIGAALGGAGGILAGWLFRSSDRSLRRGRLQRRWQVA